MISYLKLVFIILIASIGSVAYGEQKEDELSQIVSGLFQRSDELLNVIDMNIDTPLYSEYNYLENINTDLRTNIERAIDMLVMFGLSTCSQNNKKQLDHLVSSLKNRLGELDFMNKHLLLISSKTKSPKVLDYANKITIDINKTRSEFKKYLN
jgi:hypothetical protein